MHDFGRMDRLQQSAIRWLKYDVKNGTQIGITSFENSASRDKALTKLTENNRQEFVNVIDRLKPDGGTCLGKGLMKGMDVSISVAHCGIQLIEFSICIFLYYVGGIFKDTLIIFHKQRPIEIFESLRNSIC